MKGGPSNRVREGRSRRPVLDPPLALCCLVKRCRGGLAALLAVSPGCELAGWHPGSGPTTVYRDSRGSWYGRSILATTASRHAKRQTGPSGRIHNPLLRTMHRLASCSDGALVSLQAMVGVRNFHLPQKHLNVLKPPGGTPVNGLLTHGKRPSCAPSDDPPSRISWTAF